MPKFVKGHPGGPGRPRGSRNKITLLIRSLAHLGEERVLRALAEAAADGDVRTLLAARSGEAAHRGSLSSELFRSASRRKRNGGP